ncbi:MAG: 4a-hydroxytetrahydrobiopterin dehydratase [Patescibacteria group bacterium]|jgi:4a-hydroxytetrahydrobiopterin dehydratase
MSPLPREQAGALFSELPDGWVLGEASLDASFLFRTYLDGIAFVNRVAELAEAEGHHPDIAVHCRQVRLTLTTHAVKGLSENDFILAAKVSQLVSNGEIVSPH